MPRRCGPMPSIALGRGKSKTACTRSSRRPSASRETGNGAAPSVRHHLPCRAPVAEHRSSQRHPLHRPERPPLDGDRARLPDHGAAGLGSTVNLQACLVAPLTSLLAPRDQRRASLCGGWGLPPPPPPTRAPGEGHPPPSAGPSPPSSCCGAGTSSPTRAPCALRWQTSRPCICIGTRSQTGGRTWC